MCARCAVRAVAERPVAERLFGRPAVVRWRWAPMAAGTTRPTRPTRPKAPGLLAGGLAALLSTGAIAACGDGLPAAGRQRLEAPGLTLVFAPRPAPVPLGRPFALAIQVCPAEGQPMPEALAVDAEMPAHRHGMNYRPSVTAQGGGRFAAEGLMFHMPGHWRLRFDLPRPGGQPPLRLSADLTL